VVLAAVAVTVITLSWSCLEIEKTDGVNSVDIISLNVISFQSLFLIFKSLILSRVSTLLASKLVLTITSSFPLYIFVDSLQSITFLKNVAT
jgi:hypothetical protein